MFKFSKIKALLITGVSLLGLILVFILWPLSNIPSEHWSKTVYDKHGRLLRVWLAQDQQIRFAPDSDSLPSKYKQSVIHFEDRRFWKHPGIDPIAIARALFLDLKNGRIVSGGSTITMQLARLQNPQSRTIFAKISEALYALKLEWHLSKEQILRLYASEVPMGGNVVGLKAASWKLFGRPETELTWAESALLAVLPNNPSGLNLNRSRKKLLQKRNRLLNSLCEYNYIDSITLESSLEEALPQNNKPFPFIAPHFSRWVQNQLASNEFSTLDIEIQSQLKSVLEYHRSILKNKGVRNVSVLIAETQTGKIRAYEGSGNFHNAQIQGQVDGVQAPRSPGSTLKPFLYGLILQQGPWLPSTLLPDVPVWYGSFSPQNFSRNYQGLVSVQNALALSLNVPAVNLLAQYGLDGFYFWLKRAGLKHLFRPWQMYGLPLILGGGESSLWELTSLYRSLAQEGKWAPLTIHENIRIDSSGTSHAPLIDGGAAWQVLQMLKQVRRPGIDAYWHLFDNQIPVSWKTGTSYGGKDAWAMGVNPQWTIGVWVGNFDGHSSESVTGATGAAPILFSLLNRLTDRSGKITWHHPDSLLENVSICATTGYRASKWCPLTKEGEAPIHQIHSEVCPWHKRILVNHKGKRVNSDCWNINDTTWVTKLVLPPSVQYQFRLQGKSLDTLPPWDKNCKATQTKIKIEYPTPHARIFIPRDWDGEHEKIIFKVRTDIPHDTLYWYLDNAYQGMSVDVHQKVFQPVSGKHRLVVQSSDGSSKGVRFRAYVKGEE